MKIEQVTKKFKSCSCFICPLCSRPLILNSAGSFLCSSGHCFDLSSKGYINFVPNQKQQKYHKDLFLSRRNIFEAGFYIPVLQAVENCVKSFRTNKKAQLLLDVGCGEGYYSRSLSLPSCHIIGMDISRDAIAIAARQAPELHYMVADLAHIPLVSGCVDILLDILTPAHYQEFSRVLKNDGLLLKVIPGSSYLREIRSLAAARLNHPAYSNKSVVEHFCHHWNVLHRETLLYTLPVSPAQALDFIRMTPMTFGIGPESLDPSQLKQITIHLEILAGKKPG